MNEALDLICTFCLIFSAGGDPMAGIRESALIAKQNRLEKENKEVSKKVIQTVLYDHAHKL